MKKLRLFLCFISYKKVIENQGADQGGAQLRASDFHHLSLIDISLLFFFNVVLSEIVEKLIAALPAERYQCAHEVWDRHAKGHDGENTIVPASQEVDLICITGAGRGVGDEDEDDGDDVLKGKCEEKEAHVEPFDEEIVVSVSHTTVDLPSTANDLS